MKCPNCGITLSVQHPDTATLRSLRVRYFVVLGLLALRMVADLVLW